MLVELILGLANGRLLKRVVESCYNLPSLTENAQVVLPVFDCWCFQDLCNQESL